MKIIRTYLEQESPQYAWLLDQKLGAIEGDIFGTYKRNEASQLLENRKILAPIQPGKIVCVGRNYAEHAAELNNEVPTQPLLFLKPPSSVIGPADTIYLPPQSLQVEHEAELAVIIGKRGRWITPETAKDHIFGYTIANDITARDLQRSDKTWTRGKGFDSFCPIGPVIDTDFDPTDAVITCRVNGELRQMASTREMIFSIPHIIAYISSVMSLEVGDLLLTGTPAGVGALNPGDTVTVEIEGLGQLTNPVAKDDSV